MEHDHWIDEPWKYFKYIDELEAYKAELARTAELEMATRENPLRVSGTGQGSADSLRVSGTGQGSADGLRAHQANSGHETETSLCAPLEPASSAAKSGVSVSPLGITRKDGVYSGGACSHGSGASHNGSSHSGANSNDAGHNSSDHTDTDCPNVTVYAEETMAKAREICTMPHGADPAETFLMDILEDDSDSRPNTTHRLKCRMSIKFFLPEELFDLWNTVFTIWLRRSVVEETTDGTKDCDSVEVGADTFSIRKKSVLRKKESVPFLFGNLECCSLLCW